MTEDRAITPKETVEQIAVRCIEMFDKSGYGTPRGDRYTPTFDPLDVVALAHAVLADD